MRRKTAIAFKREKFPDDVYESKRRSEIVPFFHSRVLICGYTVLFRVTRKFINFLTLEKMWPTLPCLRFPKFANIFYRKFTIITPKRVIKKKKKKKKKKEELEACSFSKRKKEREPKPEHEARNTEKVRENLRKNWRSDESESLEEKNVLLEIPFNSLDTIYTNRGAGVVGWIPRYNRRNKGRNFRGKECEEGKSDLRGSARLFSRGERRNQRRCRRGRGGVLLPATFYNAGK